MMEEGLRAPTSSARGTTGGLMLASSTYVDSSRSHGEHTRIVESSRKEKRSSQMR